MKNILGTTEDLKSYNKEGVLIYRFRLNDNGIYYERTWDENGRWLTCKGSDGYFYEFTRDKYGNELTFRDSNGYSYEGVRDENGNELFFKNSKGYSHKRTFDKKGNLLTFTDSDDYHYELTWDEDDNELTYKDSNGLNRDFKVEKFLKDVVETCKKHGYSISHEDGHGSFEIEEYSNENIDWLKDANICTKTL